MDPPFSRCGLGEALLQFALLCTSGPQLDRSIHIKPMGLQQQELCGSTCEASWAELLSRPCQEATCLHARMEGLQSKGNKHVLVCGIDGCTHPFTVAAAACRLPPAKRGQPLPDEPASVHTFPGSPSHATSNNKKQVAVHLRLKHPGIAEPVAFLDRTLRLMYRDLPAAEELAAHSKVRLLSASCARLPLPRKLSACHTAQNNLAAAA